MNKDNEKIILKNKHTFFFFLANIVKCSISLAT